MPGYTIPQKITRKVSYSRGSRAKATTGRRTDTSALRGAMLRTINSQRETKVATLKVNEFYMQHGVTNKSDLQNIMPEIPQGINEYQRLGNTIRVQKIVVRGYYRVSGVPSLDASQHVSIRHMIFQQYGADSTALIDDASFDTNNLLEASSPYLGTPMNNLTPLNGSAFKVHTDKRLTLVQQSQAGAPAITEEPAFPTAGAKGFKDFVFTISFGPAGRKLTYRTGGSDIPENFPYVMAASQNTLGVASQALNVTGNPLINMSYHSTCYFHDS